MNRPLMNEEEEVHDRKCSFYLCHPCIFLEETLKAFLRCLGVETSSGSSRTKDSTKKREDEKALLKKDSVTTSQNNADPPSSTDASAMEKRGPRKPELSKGSPPQHD
ncbi:unnamed protein product [Lupinus luteus]|uniref:Uncharacterized protein n=1 Tax=Lupinus luteus TaxID=3873 RepID=A0AAV1VUG6_LUPLU